MRPALSVILLTTLIGAGQGLFLAMFGLEAHARFGGPAVPRVFGAAAAALCVGLLIAGLIASFFHLGHPERAWRAVARWRTSWLSREVIVLPLFTAAAAAWGLARWMGWDTPAWALASAGAVLCIALFVCTGMVYACLKFLQEWHSPLTVVNFLLFGAASGYVCATALALWFGLADVASRLGPAAAVLTVAAALGRMFSLARNARLRPRSTLQTAIGVKHPRIAQASRGFSADSFNTREFRHGRHAAMLRRVRWAFLGLAFALPLAAMAVGGARMSAVAWTVAFALQMIGLGLERWYFFAEARHPQNLYYQAAA